MIARKFFPCRSANWSKLFAAALVATALAVGGSAFGQGYNTTFDEGGTRYPANSIGGSLSGLDGWDTNDNPPSGGPAYVGASDYVGTINYQGSTNLGNFSGNQGAVGGLFHGTGANQDLPGSPTVYVEHPFGPASGQNYTFRTDFLVSYTSSTRDNFGFSFGSNLNTATPSANFFSLNFTPDRSGLGNAANEMVIGYTVGSTITVPPVTSMSHPPSIVYNSVYRLTISVNVSLNTFTATFTSSQATPTTFTLGPISLGSINPSTVTQFAATWGLNDTSNGSASTGYMNAGTNALIFDNVVVTVPEPSTWAMLGVGVLGLAMFVRRRVRA